MPQETLVRQFQIRIRERIERLERKPTKLRTDRVQNQLVKLEEADRLGHDAIAKQRQPDHDHGEVDGLIAAMWARAGEGGLYSEVYDNAPRTETRNRGRGDSRLTP